jgi:putative endonuclease
MRIPSRELGRRGERRAAWFYRLRGYRIVERNLRMRGGEIDLIVHRGGTLVFVEVKTRQSLLAGYGVEAVDRRKKLQIISLTSAYLARHPHDGEVRHDILSLFWTGWRFVISHYPDAFRPIADRFRPWRWTV